METEPNEKRPVRLIAIDIDGTMVGRRDEVSPAVREAVALARERGCEVVVCTGRARYTAQPIMEQLGTPGYLVASNGGVVMHPGTGEVLVRRLLPVPVALQVIHAIVEAGAGPFIYEDSTGEGVESARVLYHPERPGGVWATVPRYRPYSHPLETLPFAPVSVNTYGPPERTRPLASHLQETLTGDVIVLQSGTQHEWGVEIFVAGTDKRTGLEALTAHLNIHRDEVLAIGDHINDLEMLRWAGTGVAMGNAIPEAQQAADWVTSTIDEDGVARAIERFVLNA